MEKTNELNPELELELDALKAARGGTKFAKGIEEGGQMILKGMTKAKKSGMSFEDFMANTFFGIYFHTNHPGLENVIRQYWEQIEV